MEVNGVPIPQAVAVELVLVPRGHGAPAAKVQSLLDLAREITGGDDLPLVRVVEGELRVRVH